MSLSQEERKRVYEEEKARIEAEENQMRRSAKTTNLAPNVARLLCYVGGWISGIIFLVLEQRDRTVRFHAAQSIVVFGALSIIFSVFGSVPVVGWAFGVVVGVAALILWIFLVVKSQDEVPFRLPVAAELADRLVGLSKGAPQGNASASGVVAGSAVAGGGGEKRSEAPYSGPVPGERAVRLARQERGRPARIVGSAFIIAWELALLIFLNFFNQYIAYYHVEGTGSAAVWMRETLVTGDFSLWLPIVSVALIAGIAGHVVLIALDNYVLRQTVRIVLDVFSIVAFSALLAIYPFDFSPIPNSAVADGLTVGLRIGFGFVVFFIGVAVLVRLIRLIVNLLKGTAHY